MFIWDFVADKILGQIVDWFYGQVVGFLGNFFSEMGNMGAELFTMDWVQSIVLFFSYLAWALYGTGLVVACFETGVEYSSGRGNIRETALNAIKGFMAVSLFTVVPVRLYELCVSLQGTFTAALTGYGTSIGDVAGEVMQEFNAVESLTDLASGPFLGFGSITSGIMILFCIILMAYAIIKVFFANLKRGGILLIQIAVGSLYMFSVPRGYTDGFIQWCKQIIGLCLSAFLQATILVAGLMVFKDHALLGLGLMLSAGEIPRIAGAFGRDTSTKPHECCLYRAGRRQHHAHGRTGGGEMSRLTMGSLFDGIGGFPLAAIRSGITPVWASEIEAFPIAVTKLRFPSMTHVGDITKLNGAELPPVDIICGGSPCQDLSVAGARAGLAGARSGLFMEQMRIVREMRAADQKRGRFGVDIRPRWVCWENVPGAFSSGTPKYEDFRIVLEEIVRICFPNELIPSPYPYAWPDAGELTAGGAFSLAWRCLDAQFWGVAQRRKRIFLLADFAGPLAPQLLFDVFGETGNCGKEVT